MTRDNSGINKVYIVEACGNPEAPWGYFSDSACMSRREARQYIEEKKSQPGRWPERLRIVRFDRVGVVR